MINKLNVEKSQEIELNLPRKKEKLFNSIVEDIKKKYNYKISEVKAREAAKNLIDFYRLLLK
jgi:uncharacterized protein YlxP (DUF503 family)